MSISQNFPATWPSLMLDFANSKTLDPRVTFTRASTATYVGADGLIKTAAADEARFDHNPETGESLGLLIEESRTNLIPHSQELNAATWNKYFGSSVSANYAIAPDGTQTADRIIFNGDQYGQVVHNLNGLTIGQQYVFSAWVKSDGSSNNGCVLYVNGTSIQIIPTSEWKRIYLVRTAANTGENPLFLCGVANSLLIWGVQFEKGSFPTSYIPTSGSAVTRPAEKVVATQLLSSLNTTQVGHTFIIDYDHIQTNYYRALFYIGGTDGIEAWYGVNSSNLVFNHRKPIATVVQINFTTPVPSTRVKMGMSIAEDNVSATRDGLSPIVNTNATITGVASNFNLWTIGSTNTPTEHLNSTIRSIRYYPFKVTDTQLQELTK